MKMNLLQLPSELLAYPQWAVSTMSINPETNKPDKSPRNPFTRERVSVTDPTGWATFEDAANSGAPQIGFLLTGNDPFVIIDLDRKPDTPQSEIDAQNRILQMFESYVERSASGNGMHIILYGEIGGGLRRGSVEIYDRERYMICTGDVVRPGPVRSHPELLAALVNEMGGVAVGSGDGMGESEPERATDDEILARARSQKNGEKFADLYDRTPYEHEDWSQRDAALIQMLAYHTRNHDQLMRLFMGSRLYRPDGKAGMTPQQYHATYLRRNTFARALAAERARDADLAHGRQLAEGLMAAHREKEAAQLPIKAPETLPAVIFPPGLIGEVAQFIMQAAPRPIPEVALAGALTFCAGLCGRQYQYGGQGLNLYIVLVAPTGAGKEGASSGIAKLMSACMKVVPSILEFRGAARIASGQALFKDLKEKPCHFMINKEFGKTLKLLTSTRMSEVHETYKQVVLDLFTMSGRHDVMNGMTYSDREKNVAPIYAPAFTLFGETTPEDYFPIFTQQNVADGFLPRFLTLRYEGLTPYRSKDMLDQPPPELVERISAMVVRTAKLAYDQEFLDVVATPDAANRLEELSVFATDVNNKGRLEGQLFYQLWNRFELKVQRIAALLAVTKNWVTPTITVDDVNWAEQLVRADIEDLLNRVVEGEVGSDDAQQESAVVKAVHDFLRMTPEKRVSYVTQKLADAAAMNYSYFRRRFRGRREFVEDRRGEQAAVRSALQDAVDLGYLSEVSNDQKALFNVQSSTKVYVAGPNLPKPK